MWLGQWWQPQPLPHPPLGAAGSDGAVATEAPVDANIDSRRTVSRCPLGQVAASLDSSIDRRTSKRSSQVRHRNSYSGIGRIVPAVSVDDRRPEHAASTEYNGGRRSDHDAA